MPSAVDAWVNAYLRRLWVGEFLQWAADVCAIFCLCFGLSVLSVKLFLPGLWPYVLWLAIGVLPAAFIAWQITCKHRWTRFDAIVRMDQAVNAQGLLITIYERAQQEHSTDAWTEYLAVYETQWQRVLPRIRPSRFASNMALPLLFAISVCFVPLRQATSAGPQRNSLSQKTTRDLSDLVELMQQQKLLEDSKEELQVKSEIQKLAEETKYKPLTHEQWEAVDALQERLMLRINAANSAISKASNAARQLQAADDAAELLQNLDDEASQNQLAEAFDALDRTMGTPGMLAVKKGQLQKLCQAGSKGGSGKPRQKLSKVESDELEELKEFLDEEQKKLNELKKQCQSKCLGDEGYEGDASSDGDGEAGQGSISRGRGDAKLTWGKEPDSNGFLFKEIVLPERDADEPNDAIVKIERTAPTVDPSATAPRSATRQADPAAGVSTWNRKLSPRHRNIVQKYFDGH